MYITCVFIPITCLCPNICPFQLIPDFQVPSLQAQSRISFNLEIPSDINESCGLLSSFLLSRQAVYLIKIMFKRTLSLPPLFAFMT